MKPYNEIEPFFITEEIEAELIAAGYAFVLPGHARTARIRELFGWQPGETLSEPVSRHLMMAGTASGCEPRGEGL
ncbi:transcriptional regulator [Pollutimonas sp. M17]|uniref:transcriptional regulator n=1 Tax=Pollutimonas sp. M17 TaxID=2962065 RepID=UPI0021F3F802|nr:transcriptional regulator [Pollutimonas sp. M17]UYO94341.1 transcriptional regulator [Pollutimonas sp. M17]